MIVHRSVRSLAVCGLLVLLTSGCAWVERMSLDSSGTEADGGSLQPAISGDGRYVAFESFASNLVAGDTNDAYDVFLRDAVSGTTIRASVNNAGNGGDEQSLDPAVSADGRYVAFASYASNIVVGDTNGAVDVFVRDVVAGTTSRVSVSSAEAQANSSSDGPSISSDGRYVAFVSGASNLVGGDTNDDPDIFVRDTIAGTTSRVSVSSTGAEGDSTSSGQAISADGRYVAFFSSASNLVPGDTNGFVGDVFVRDTIAGTTSLVTVDSVENPANDQSFAPAISADGRYVAFHSIASNLVAGDTNSHNDVFVRDTVAGTTIRVSVSSTGTQADDDSLWPAISGDGRYVAFESLSSNLVAGDTGRADVFVRDTVAGTTVRVSARRVGSQLNSNSFQPAISSDGRLVAFESFASNLVAGDTNGAFDIFVRANPEPTVTDVAPATLTHGTTTPVTVTGSHFLSGAQLVIDGDGLTVANVTVVSETEITADVTVAADATLSARNVFVELPGTAPAPAISAVGLCAGCLTVN